MLTREDLYMRSDGAKIPRNIWNALVDAVFAGRLTSVVGGEISGGSGGGTTLHVRSGGGGGGVKTPFKLTGLIVEEAAYIRVRPGLVDNIVPTINGVSIAGFTGSPLAPPKLAVSGATGQVWIKNTLDAAGTITESIIESGADMPADTETLAYRILGSFTSDDGVFTSVTSLLTTNQSHKRCGGVSTWGSA